MSDLCCIRVALTPVWRKHCDRERGRGQVGGTGVAVAQQGGGRSATSWTEGQDSGTLDMEVGGRGGSQRQCHWPVRKHRVSKSSENSSRRLPEDVGIDTSSHSLSLHSAASIWEPIGDHLR